MVKARKNAPQMLKGTLDLLILKALHGGARHGYGITVWLENHSDGVLAVEDSAVYQALHRLEGRGLVEARWGVTENSRRARYYELTALGSAELASEADLWERYARSVGHILALPDETE